MAIGIGREITAPIRLPSTEDVMRHARKLAAILLMPLLGCECRPPDIVHQTVPVAPDLAVYCGGVQFESGDNLKLMHEVVITPRLLTDEVMLVLPDDSAVSARDITPGFLNEHGVHYEMIEDDGMGGCYLRADCWMQIEFVANRPIRIAVYSEFRHTTSTIRIRMKDKTFAVPIEREELETLLGKPDAIKLDSFPKSQ